MSCFGSIRHISMQPAIDLSGLNIAAIRTEAPRPVQNSNTFILAQLMVVVLANVLVTSSIMSIHLNAAAQMPLRTCNGRQGKRQKRKINGNRLMDIFRGHRTGVIGISLEVSK